MKTAISAALIAAAIAIAGVTLGADVKTDEKSTFKLEGVMGKMVSLFSKTARNGTTATVAVKGDRKMMLTDDRGELIDLGEDKVYTLDLKHKTYTVATFEELRRRMQEAHQRAEADARKAQAKGQEPAPSAKGGQEPQLEIEVDVKDTGQKKSLNGFDTHEVVMTVTAHEKSKTIEQAGGLMLTSSMWLAPTVPALKEIAEFDQRYARKLATAMLGGASPEDAAAASAMHPMLKDVTVRMHSEQAKLSGVPIQTTTTRSMPCSRRKRWRNSRNSPIPGAALGFGGRVVFLLADSAGKAAQQAADSRSGPASTKAEDLDGEKAVALGRERHVDLVFMGTVLEAKTQQSNKSGWIPSSKGQSGNVSIRRVKATVTLQGELYDVASGKRLFSVRVTGNDSNDAFGGTAYTTFGSWGNDAYRAFLDSPPGKALQLALADMTKKVAAQARPL